MADAVVASLTPKAWHLAHVTDNAGVQLAGDLQDEERVILRYIATSSFRAVRLSERTGWEMRIGNANFS